MNSISFNIDHDLSQEIGRHAAEAGMTGSAWIAASLSRWLEGDALATELEAALASLRQTLAEATTR